MGPPDSPGLDAGSDDARSLRRELSRMRRLLNERCGTASELAQLSAQLAVERNRTSSIVSALAVLGSTFCDTRGWAADLRDTLGALRGAIEHSSQPEWEHALAMVKTFGAAFRAAQGSASQDPAEASSASTQQHSGGHTHKLQRKIELLRQMCHAERRLRLLGEERSQGARHALEARSLPALQPQTAPPQSTSGGAQAAHALSKQSEVVNRLVGMVTGQEAMPALAPAAADTRSESASDADSAKAGGLVGDGMKQALAERSEARSQLSKAQSQIEETNQALARVERDLSLARLDEKKVAQSNALAKEREDAALHQAEDAQAETHETEGSMHCARSRADAAEMRADKLLQQLTEQEEDHVRQIAHAEQHQAQAVTRAHELEAAFDHARVRILLLSSEVNRVKTEHRREEKQREHLQQQLEQTRSELVLLPKGGLRPLRTVDRALEMSEAAHLKERATSANLKRELEQLRIRLQDSQQKLAIAAAAQSETKRARDQALRQSSISRANESELSCQLSELHTKLDLERSHCEETSKLLRPVEPQDDETMCRLMLVAGERDEMRRHLRSLETRYTSSSLRVNDLEERVRKANERAQLAEARARQAQTDAQTAASSQEKVVQQIKAETRAQEVNLLQQVDNLHTKLSTTEIDKSVLQAQLDEARRQPKMPSPSRLVTEASDLGALKARVAHLDQELNRALVRAHAWEGERTSLYGLLHQLWTEGKTEIERAFAHSQQPPIHPVAFSPPSAASEAPRESPQTLAPVTERADEELRKEMANAVTAAHRDQEAERTRRIEAEKRCDERVRLVFEALQQSSYQVHRLEQHKRTLKSHAQELLHRLEAPQSKGTEVASAERHARYAALSSQRLALTVCRLTSSQLPGTSSVVEEAAPSEAAQQDQDPTLFNALPSDNSDNDGQVQETHKGMTMSEDASTFAAEELMSPLQGTDETTLVNISRSATSTPWIKRRHKISSPHSSCSKTPKRTHISRLSLKDPVTPRLAAARLGKTYHPRYSSIIRDGHDPFKRVKRRSGASLPQRGLFK